MLETRGGLRFRSPRRRVDDDQTKGLHRRTPREFRGDGDDHGNDPVLVLSPKKESLSWPGAIRNPEERGGGGGYNGQNEIVLGHEGTFARVFIEPDTPRFLSVGYTTTRPRVLTWIHRRGN